MYGGVPSGGGVGAARKLVVFRIFASSLFCRKILRLFCLHSLFWNNYNSGPKIYLLYLKVKISRYRPGVAQRVGRGIAVLFHDRGTRRGWMVSSTLRPHFIPGKDPVPILQGAGWNQGRSGRAENLFPTGIWSRTVQPVVSRYTGWATRPTFTIYMYIYIFIYIYVFIYLYISDNCIKYIFYVYSQIVLFI